ncbi:MAG: alpha-L-rhamnosidase [Anaerolineales bacterium]|nr:alpha-L-rhamnosidase [Anaerolineales bacterium]
MPLLPLLVLLWLGGRATGEVFASKAANEGAYTVYLPLINNYKTLILSADPIWPTDEAPAGHAVALFRKLFTRPEGFEQVQLAIFADTRYEVWVDGQFVGRGPARFTTTYHEYDTYDLNSLPPGNHQIAVLVQWSPNLRRAESTTPYLQAVITGKQNDRIHLLEATGPEWKATLSTAWETQAVPVHPWQLIGTTELMDFREFPWGWTLVGFDDQLWPDAVPLALDLNRVVYQPRSIAPLANLPMPYTVLAAGQLNPGMGTAEIVPPVSTPYEITFTALDPTVLMLEHLTPTGSTVSVDGAPLPWQAASADRPDTQTASVNVGLGPHTLQFQQLPAEGLTFNYSTANLSWNLGPLSQGLHAGRRLLLAKYTPAPDILTQTPTSFTLNTAPAYFVLALPRTVHGRVVAQVTGPAGTVVDIGWSERLLPNTTRPLPYPGTLYPDWNQTDSWVLDGDPHKLTTLDARAGRYLLIAVWGGPVTFQNLQILEERYPVTQAGTFTSSDPLLNQIWQMGVDTAAINMLDAYADPWRERGQWWGDAYVIDHLNQVVFGDETLLRRGLKLMADGFIAGRPVAMSPNGNALDVHMLDYGMLWTHSLQEYLLRTDDHAFALELYPTLVSFMDYLGRQTSPETGLLDLPLVHWSQSAYIDTYGFFDRYGQSTALNSLYHETLLRAAWIATYLGDASRANTWNTTAPNIRGQINLTLYDPAAHQYASNRYQGQLRPATVQAQAWALAYGIVPPADVPAVADHLLAMIPADPANAQISIYGFYWILEGLGQAGKMQEAVNLIDVYYGAMVNKGATTFWERFDSDQDYGTSLSHGWGGAPTWFLTTHIAGLQPTSPESWRAQPALELFPSFTATLPFAPGPVTLSWQTTTCQTTVMVQAPSNSTGELILPAYTAAITRLDGTPILFEATEKPISLALTGGTTTLVVGEACETVSP